MTKAAKNKVLTAHDVFVPSSFPEHTYVSRGGDDLEDKLRFALKTKGQIVSLSGPSKSGKTVLVEKVVGKDKLVPVVGAGIREPEQVWTRVLDWIDAPADNTTMKSWQLQTGARVGADPTRVTEVREVVNVRDYPICVARINGQVDERMDPPPVLIPELPWEPLSQAGASGLPAALPALCGKRAVRLNFRTQLEQRFADERSRVDPDDARKTLVAARDRIGEMDDSEHFLERGLRARRLDWTHGGWKDGLQASISIARRTGRTVTRLKRTRYIRETRVGERGSVAPNEACRRRLALVRVYEGQGVACRQFANGTNM